MEKPQFKVGDKVKVVPSEDAKDYYCFDKRGQIFIVCENKEHQRLSGPSYIHYDYSFLTDTGIWITCGKRNFQEKDLRLLTPLEHLL